ncbi:MAG: aspartate ammonia-lyase [Clostridiales bacterium]|nr:aspartate ammonia-lyase [Clostridiales bacterium]
MKTRTESDSIGKIEVPADAYYGVHALRGYENFQITGKAMNSVFVKNIVKIKKVAAKLNGEYGYADKTISGAIIQACDEILAGGLWEYFITDAIQGGAGTSVNMNVNEVVANRASEILGGVKGEYLCHPNDHVNCGQSTNDVIPTAGKLTVLDFAQELLKSLRTLIDALKEKAQEFDGVLKMGRTQLQDALPIRLGQEFNAYAVMMERNYNRIQKAIEEMYSINLGGTAIGTCVNAGKEYCAHIVEGLACETGYPLKRAEDLVDSTQNVDGFAVVSGALKTCALNLSKMCNDLRLMSSGPKTGLSEIVLPARQNGSSIMPGKINPVIPEVVSQVAFAIVGNDVTIAMAVEGGQLELNAFEPVIFYKLFESFTCLSNAIKTLTVNCISGITANKQRCEDLVNSSVGVVTALCPYLGYKKSAELAKESLATNVSVKELVLKYGLMDEETLTKLLDPYAMT